MQEEEETAHLRRQLARLKDHVMALLTTSSSGASASQDGGVWQARVIELESLVDELQRRERQVRAWHGAIKLQINETSRLMEAQEAEAAAREGDLSAALAAARADALATRRELATSEAEVLGLTQALDSLRVRQQERDLEVAAREQEAGEVLRQAKDQVEALAAALEAARAADEEKGQRLAVAEAAGREREARLGRTEAALAEARREGEKLRAAHAALLHEAEGLRAMAGKAQESEGRLAAVEEALARERARRAARAALLRERGLLEEAIMKEADRIARCLKAVGRGGPGPSHRHRSGGEDEEEGSGTEPDDAADADPAAEQSLSIVAASGCH